jgi:hypothetical protein
MKMILFVRRHGADSPAIEIIMQTTAVAVVTHLSPQESVSVLAFAL